MRNVEFLIATAQKVSISELFCSAFPHIRTEYREIQNISPYPVRMRENTEQNNSEYGQFSGTHNLYPLFIHIVS